MKIIELLNKIANKEELPIKIKYENNIYEYKGLDYFCEEIHKWFFTEGFDKLMLDLNDDIKIISSEEYEKIEKLPIEEEYMRSILEPAKLIREKKYYGTLVDIALKINELIDNQNEINKKLKETERE